MFTKILPIVVLVGVLTLTAVSPVLQTQATGGGSVPCINTGENCFKDVPASHSLALHIYTLRYNEVLGGYSDNTFRPDVNISRGQLAKIAFNGFFANFGDQFDTTCGDFKDVPKTHTFYNEITSLKCKGVVNGSNGYFYPEKNINRGETTAIVIKAARIQVKGSDDNSFLPAMESTMLKMKDVPVSHVFFGYINSAYSADIVGGYPDNTFKPENSVTRGQVAKIVEIAMRKTRDSANSSASNL